MRLLEALSIAEAAGDRLTLDRRVLDLIASRAEELGCRRLFAASPSGERLLGALLHLGAGRYQVWRPPQLGPVLVIDGAVVATFGLRQAMSQVQTLIEAPVWGLAFREGGAIDADSGEASVMIASLPHAPAAPLRSAI